MARVEDPPQALTPGENDEFHPAINVVELKASCLESSLHAPESKAVKPSTVEDSSAIIQISVRGRRSSQQPDASVKANELGRPIVEKADDNFRFDIDALDCNDDSAGVQ